MDYVFKIDFEISENDGLEKQEIRIQETNKIILILITVLIWEFSLQKQKWSITPGKVQFNKHSLVKPTVFGSIKCVNLRKKIRVPVWLALR